MLSAIDPDLRAPRSVREAGVHPAHRRVASSDLPAQVVDVIRDEDDEPGTIAVLVPRSRYDAVERARSGGPESAGPPANRCSRWSTRPPICAGTWSLTVMQTKGLEFDSVIVADPAGIIAESGRDVTVRGADPDHAAADRPAHRRKLPAVLGRLREPAA